MKSPIDRYACPHSHAPLRLAGGTLRTADGAAQYPVQDGIPRFSRFAPAETAEIRQELDRLNRLARQAGWAAALNEVYRHNPAMIRYVTDPARAAFIDLLPLTAESDVLEIGSGLGQFTAALARRSRQVFALEVVAGQAEFAAERCRQQGAANVQIAAGGDDCRLPYAPASFDAVILNLVLEWCGSRSPQDTEYAAQTRLLAEAGRVLRPGGVLYLSSKNRFALAHLIGKRDEHCHGLRFGSALPERLAMGLLRRKGHTRLLGKLHSHNKLTAMLREAGFREIRSLWATPEMRFPAQYVPTDAASIRKARRHPGLVQGDSRSTAFLMALIPARLVRYFTPGLTFLATKRG